MFSAPTKAKPSRIQTTVVATTLAVLVLCATLLVPVRAVAAGAVDLIVQLQVPAAAGVGSAFEATMTIANRGADPATNVELSLSMDSGTTSITAAPGTATDGASPAEQLTVTGVIPTLPSLPWEPLRS